jgi:hypothetical protein
MQFRRLTAFFAAGMFAAAFLPVPLLHGQNASPSTNQDAVQDAAPAANPNSAPTWTESPMDELADHASFHTDFTFDKSMLNAFAQSDPEDRPIVARLRSITVHSYRYSAPGLYNPAALAAVRRVYNGNGWQHVLSKEPSAYPTEPDGSPAPNTELQPLHPTRTDVWVRLSHADVDGAVIIVANERNINWIVVDGMISPLDLLHLRGHLGIPQFDSDGMRQAR